MKQFIALLLVAACCLGLAACDFGAAKLKELAGTWEYTEALDADEVRDVLEGWDFYEEEIALLDLNSFSVVGTMSILEDKTYSFAYNGEKSRNAIRESLSDAFDDMYENREQLNEVYDTDLSDYTAAEFRMAYATMYELEDFDTLLEDLTDAFYDYEALNDPYETGTVRISGEKIYFTITGETDASYVTYSLNGNALTLVFLDDTRHYTRVG